MRGPVLVVSVRGQVGRETRHASSAPPEGLAGTPPGPGGSSREGHLTSKAGISNGGGRTNGGGFTNGGGRTNGGGFTNGTGRTNGGGLMSGGRVRALTLTSARRSRRRAAASLSVALIVTISLGAVLGFPGAAPDGVRFDGALDEWSGQMTQAPGAGLTAFGVQTSGAGPVAAFSFDAPVEGRADIWVFIDTDLDATTGYFDGALGADAAVLVRADGGQALAASALRFTGTDPFDLNSLVATGPSPVGLRGADLEVGLPVMPAAMSVAVAGLDHATSTGGFDLEGQVMALEPPTPALSGDVRNGVRVDGDFSDWQTVTRVEEPVSPDLPGRLDIAATAAIGDDASAQFYVSAREEILVGTLPLRALPITPAEAAAVPSVSVPTPPRRIAGTDLLEVYLDTDSDPTTGTLAFGLGAEVLLRVEGVGGYAVGSYVFVFDAAAGWKLAEAAAEAAASAGELEASIALPGLVGADARFVLQGFDGARDVSTVPVAVGQVSGSAVSPGYGSLTLGGASGRDLTVNPIPEISEVFAVAAGVFLIFFVGRGRRRPDAGTRRGD